MKAHHIHLYEALHKTALKNFVYGCENIIFYADCLDKMGMIYSSHLKFQVVLSILK